MSQEEEELREFMSDLEGYYHVLVISMAKMLDTVHENIAKTQRELADLTFTAMQMQMLLDNVQEQVADKGLLSAIHPVNPYSNSGR